MLPVTGRSWVQFTIWSRFSLYGIHVVVLKQNSNITDVSISLHCDMILPFFASTQVNSHIFQRLITGFVFCQWMLSNSFIQQSQPSIHMCNNNEVVCSENFGQSCYEQGKNIQGQWFSYMLSPITKRWHTSVLRGGEYKTGEQSGQEPSHKCPTNLSNNILNENNETC